MNKNEFLNILKEDNKIFEKKFEQGVILKDCIKVYEIEYDNVKYNVSINLATLDIVDSNIPNPLGNNLGKIIKGSKITKEKYRRERRPLIKLLNYFYNEDFIIINRESPDFLLKCNNKEIMFEVVEATNEQKANFDSFCRRIMGMGKTVDEFKQYANKYYKTMANKFSIEEIQGHVVASECPNLIDSEIVRLDIKNAIEKKVNKYKKYNISNKAAEKNILVFFVAAVGFELDSDYIDVGDKIRELNIDNIIDKIFVINMDLKFCLIYNRNGEILNKFTYN